MTALERELQNRSLRREVNERIAELIEGFHDGKGPDPVMTVFCECGSDECMAPIEMTLVEYRAVRAGPTRFTAQRPSSIAWYGCIEATTPSRASRGASAGRRCWACSIRKRRSRAPCARATLS